MAEDSRKEAGSSKGISMPTCSDLRGKQSIRATFKLSEKSIETVSVVAAQLGIKQKSLFDHLIEDIGSLNVIAQELERDTFHDLDRVRSVFHILLSFFIVGFQFLLPRL